MDTTNPKTTRGCSETTGVSDTRELKQYVFELTPPRFTTGGLLSSWLADQQFFRDGCKWTLLCPLHPREQGGHKAALLPVLGSGMFQVLRVCRSVTALCREVFTHLTSGSRRTHLCESKWVHTLVVKRLPVTSKLTVTGKDATPPHRNVKWSSEEVILLLSLWSMVPDSTIYQPRFDLEKPLICVFRVYSAFGLLGNKGMHCYNGNVKLQYCAKWYELMLTIYEEDKVPLGWVRNFIELIWKNLNYCHQTKHSNCPLNVLNSKIYVLKFTEDILEAYRLDVPRSRRPALNNNMIILIEWIFELKEMHPSWFKLVKVKAMAKPVEYKVRYIDRIIAIISALPPRKRKS